ncbi:hypothetical protein [Formosa sp. PL04]|uniref:hypothetical protein n=1 Tax=Formosa sp. PL04 TaxID=3081755 RepID=UPI0029824C0C|nr:hypothetical protein [Formosa sp. PL04]MDW5290854.1 hypothetical protein [Formosa sp. PL04]
MGGTVQIKCPNCGLFNTNADHCSNCGTLLSYKKRRELAHEEQEKKRKEREETKKKSSPSWIESGENSNYLIVRIGAKIMKSVAMIVIAIGAFFAWLFTFLAA